MTLISGGEMPCPPSKEKFATQVTSEILADVRVPRATAMADNYRRWSTKH